jgi:molecular chaperone GrpE
MAKDKKDKIKENEENEMTEPTEEFLELSIDEVAEMQEAMLSLQNEVQENKDNWLRAQADFENYKKRNEARQIMMHEDAATRVIKQFLPSMDDMKRALDNQPNADELSDWIAGIELIYQKFHVILGNEGVIPMDVAGQDFDPNFHEAISQEESPDHKSGEIIEEIQTGYMIGERVLRHALVRVAS